MSLYLKAEAARSLLCQIKPFFITYTQFQGATGIGGFGKDSLMSVLNHELVKELSPWVLNLCKITEEILYTNISSKDLPDFQETWNEEGIQARTLNQIIAELGFDIKTAEELRSKYKKQKSSQARFFPASMLFDLNKLKSKVFLPFEHHFQIRFDHEKKEFSIAASEDIIKYIGETPKPLVLVQNRNGSDEPDANFLIRGLLRDGELHLDDFIRCIFPPSEIEKNYDSIVKNIGHYRQSINSKVKSFLKTHHKKTGYSLKNSCKNLEFPYVLILYDKKTKMYSFNYKVLNLNPFH